MENEIIRFLLCFLLGYCLSLFIGRRMRKNYEYSGRMQGQVDVLYLVSSAFIKIHNLEDENKDNKELAAGLEMAMDIVDKEIQKLRNKEK